jgi:molybdopterin synthase catalytic subunit
MRTIRIETQVFDVNAEIAALTKHTNNVGAAVTFTGHVRGDDDLTALTLEHYSGMTEREIARCIDAAEKRWPLLGSTIIHRIGTLVPGDPIVLVAVASTHRKDAFSAAEFLMDYLKTRAPFWKEEVRRDQARWVESRASDEERAKRWD